MRSELEDGFNNLDIALTESIEAGMNVGQARQIVECVLSLREMRERLEFVLAGNAAPGNTYEVAFDALSDAKIAVEGLPVNGVAATAAMMQFAALGHLEAARLCVGSARVQGAL